MKKKIIIITVVILALVIGMFLFRLNSMNNALNDASKDFKNILQSITNMTKSYSIPEEGILDINAIYKGAHGERYPKGFSYNYMLKENGLLLATETGYNSHDINIDFGVFNIIKKLDKIDFIKDGSKKNGINKVSYSLLIDDLNNTLGTSYKEGRINYIFSGINPKLDKVEVTLDKDTITYEDKKLSINYGNNKISYMYGDRNYSLNINDYLKLNSVKNNEIEKINMVIDNDTYLIEISDENIIVKVNGNHAIYTGLELTIKKEIIPDGLAQNEIAEIDIPLYRYFNDISYSIWR